MSGSVDGQCLHLGFDRGTILLRGLKSDAAARLPGIIWDPRVGAYRTPARHYAGVRAKLDALGIRVTDEVRPVAATPASWKRMDLRPYQEAALWRLAAR